MYPSRSGGNRSKDPASGGILSVSHQKVRSLYYATAVLSIDGEGNEYELRETPLEVRVPGLIQTEGGLIHAEIDPALGLD